MAGKKKEKPKHLGRGLQSLLGPITPQNDEALEASIAPALGANFPSDKHLHESLRELEIEKVFPNPYQPRTNWNESDLTDLAESIRANGVIQPIIVRPAGQRYQIIAGERRFRASQIAELKTIPAMVRDATDAQMLELALAENIHRADLNPMERAKAYQNYINTFSLTQAQAAERLGESRPVVANYLRLLELPLEISQMLVNGELTMGHARAILGLPTDDLRRKLANRALAGRLSVREVEKLVRKHMDAGSKPSRQIRDKSPHIMDLESKLSSELSTKVNIETRKSGQRGKIVIEFYSLDDFERITDRIGLGELEEV